ncbi:BTAD domain-containing putative transcriptional regulator [Saccharothrix violaceirubra]|uniref:Putative ATPase n=1 Tax=Saccharothrix violaceirubra TaxID=413306 RepID=A0A7W7T4X9_9PSEU|nr:BTAD domain-containing putative transcriptional regulator [Saccharothrix violaceirubra]MBB4966625.1 putative ATPase [Saccharothrix violaceirubra]
MRVGVLGPLQVTDGDVPVAIGGARLRVLLVRLAMAPGRVVTVEEIVDALWPDGTAQPADAVSAVRSLVSRLRRALPDAGALGSAAAGYRLDVPADDVDSHRFDRLAREARRALGSGDADGARVRLAEALDLWRGPALADAATLPFATGYVAGLDEARLGAVEDLAEADLLSGRTDHLVAGLTDLAARHPLRERTRALLLRTLAAVGRPAEALAAYEDARRALADELGADPGPDLREAYLEVLRAEPARRPRTGGVRAPLTSLVGREREVVAIGEDLAAHRLVTLVGPGGAGKTRLATEIAAKAPSVWLVELASVTDAADLVPAVLGVLALREPTRTVDIPLPSADPLARAVEVLSHAGALLVLDNCEHLLDASARFAAELLGRCPRLRVLCTSREPLGVTGEAVRPVPPLDVAGPDAPVDALSSGAAVVLFAERAAAVRSGFAVTPDNAAVVAEVCRRLDGLPLAIELAAARLRALSVEQLAERLDDRFRLLTGGSRTALPRHRTLHAVVAWSWDLLDDDERDFAERLAVYAGGVEADTAEALVGDRALDLLTALVDKSLLQVVEAPRPRYRMLETIREYGLERLAETGRVAAAHAAHAAFFRDLAESAEPHLRTADQVRWINRLDAERDNLLAALHFTTAGGDVDTTIRLSAALGLFWTMRGSSPDAIGWLRLALGLPGGPRPQRLAVEAFLLLNLIIAGGFEELAAHTASLRVVAEGAVDYPDHPFLPLVGPLIGLITDDYLAANEALAPAEGHPDPWTRAMLDTFRCGLLENIGDMAGAREVAERAIDGFRVVGDRFGLAQLLTEVAPVYQAFGEVDRAVAALEEAVRLRRELDPDDDLPFERMMLAATRAVAGDVDRARAECRASSLPAFEGPTAYAPVVMATLTLGNLARYEGDLAEAGREYRRAADASARTPHVPQFSALVAVGFAHLAAAKGDLETAGEQARTAVAHALAAKDMPVLARSAVAVARLRLLSGDAAGAARVLGVAARLRGAPDPRDPDVIAVADLSRADIGDAAYDLAYAAGLALDREDAVKLVDEDRASGRSNPPVKWGFR